MRNIIMNFKSKTFKMYSKIFLYHRYKKNFQNFSLTLKKGDTLTLLNKKKEKTKTKTMVHALFFKGFVYY